MLSDASSETPGLELVTRLLRELDENPDARGLAQAMMVVVDLRTLEYDPRRARLAPDSVVQELLYEMLDNPQFRLDFVRTLLEDDSFEYPKL